jgi:hypothetical protein
VHFLEKESGPELGPQFRTGVLPMQCPLTLRLAALTSNTGASSGGTCRTRQALSLQASPIGGIQREANSARQRATGYWISLLNTDQQNETLQVYRNTGS